MSWFNFFKKNTEQPKKKTIKYKWVGVIEASFINEKNEKTVSWAWTLYENEKNFWDRYVEISNPFYEERAKTHPRYYAHINPWLKGLTIPKDIFITYNSNYFDKIEKSKKQEFKLLKFPELEKPEEEKKPE